MILIVAYLTLCGLSIAISVWGETELKNFLVKNSAIANDKSLNEYKTMVRLNMYLSLAQIVILGTALCVGLALISSKGASAGFFVTLMLLGVYKLGKGISKLEKQAQTLPCTTNDLDRQHKKITEIWIKKPFPNF